MSRWTAHCPAKINLGLAVLGRRDDGFHELVTVFQAVDLHDTLELQPDASLSLSVIPQGSAPADGSNLVLRAAALYRERVPSARKGARLTLTKRIPAGGGLGGGSSDAAGALLLFREAWGGAPADSDLKAMAEELGSDVPFFLTGGTALGTGRGETIERLPAIAERPVLLGVPPFGLSTAEVYQALRPPLTHDVDGAHDAPLTHDVDGAHDAPLTPRKGGVTVTPLFVNYAKRNDFARITNDLEAPAFEMRPGLVAFRDALMSAGAEVALLCGSGSTVFGLFPAGADLAPAASRLGRSFPDWTLDPSRTLGTGVRIERT
jgi:4-diphosphocytidyl-2-C-methyl-D-erythritol kinase